jgi:ABC-type molybdenum transport system ATPase subunit/photorepair protein PhrA
MAFEFQLVVQKNNMKKPKEKKNSIKNSPLEVFGNNQRKKRKRKILQAIRWYMINQITCYKFT